MIRYLLNAAATNAFNARMKASSKPAVAVSPTNGIRAALSAHGSTKAFRDRLRSATA